MTSIILSGLGLSILHAVIPNHWIPLVTISRKEKWSLRKTLQITFFAGGAHVLSTIIIGLLISYLSFRLSENFSSYMTGISSLLLIGLGLFFIYRHYHHHHFHIDDNYSDLTQSKKIQIIVLSMFFSPCLEIEALYILAGQEGWPTIILLSLLYTIVTLLGMITWVYLVYRGLERFNQNWHKLEHNSGIISGAILIATGLIVAFV